MNRLIVSVYWSVPITSLKNLFHCRSDWLTHSRHIANGSGTGGVVGSLTVLLLRRDALAGARTIGSGSAGPGPRGRDGGAQRGAMPRRPAPRPPGPPPPGG